MMCYEHFSKGEAVQIPLQQNPVYLATRISRITTWNCLKLTKIRKVTTEFINQVWGTSGSLKMCYHGLNFSVCKNFDAKGNSKRILGRAKHEEYTSLSITRRHVQRHVEKIRNSICIRFQDKRRNKRVFIGQSSTHPQTMYVAHQPCCQSLHSRARPTM